MTSKHLQLMQMHLICHQSSRLALQYSELIKLHYKVVTKHRVIGGRHQPPIPTERSVQISRTTLFKS